MALRTSKFATLLAAGAALSMTAAPLAAAELPSAGTDNRARAAAGTAWIPDDVEGENRRWRRHRDRGIDAGDVLAGVLIIGGIAAIASAASSDKDRSDRRARDDDRYRNQYPEDRGYYEDRDQARYNGQSRGFDAAVDLCVDQVERGSERVASVDAAARVEDGWNVSGQLSQGGAYSCWIDSDMRIRDISLGTGYYEGASSSVNTEAQWDDDSYAEARANVRADDRYLDADYGENAQIDGDLAYEDY